MASEEAADVCGDLLAKGLADAAAAWGPFRLAPDAFAARALEVAARRLARDGATATPEALRDVVGRMPLADLALAVACAQGDGGAWETLVARLRPRLEGLARKHGASDADAVVLANDALAEMSVPAGPRGRRPIDGYEATGSLFGWAAVVLVRRLHRARAQASRRPVATDLARGDDAPREPAEPPGADPARASSGAEAVERFRRALAAAWTGLSGRERLALVWRYLDGTPQTRIAVLLRVSEPHTSRILAAALARLREAVRTALGGDAAAEDGVRPDLVEALRRHLADARLVSPATHEPLPGGGTPPPRGPR
jgi:RNA polymerase sigma factor (sigma-70 family)